MKTKDPVVLRNVLSPQTLAVAQQYFKHKFYEQIESGDLTIGDGQVDKRYSVYGEPLAQAILHELTPKFSEAVGKEIISTHSFMSLYIPGSKLPPHKDRPECEYTATLTIYNEPNGFNWPVHVRVETEDSDEYVDVDVNLNPGDATIYLGGESLHWRHQQDEGYNISIFFHFIDPDGKQKDNPRIHDVLDVVDHDFNNDILLSEVLNDTK